MKKILFSAYSLDIGGIETALVTLMKYLVKYYDITLVLEKKQGEFLKDIPKEVKIITYTPCKIKIAIIRKIINLFKQIKFKMKYKNSFDFAADYATYSLPASFVARSASKNNAIWIHNNYMNFYDNDIKMYRNFFSSIKIKEFKKIIFVSDLDKRIFTAQFPELIKNTIVCNNLIDYEKIEKLSKEEIELKKENKITFLNVGRHDEKQKKISRIIEAADKLNKSGYRGKFRVLLIGKGSASKEYEKIIEEKNIDNIYMLGPKKNPYPYFKISDAFILSSEFEGYPVVFVESQILGLPIITTNVSDSKKEIEGKYGLVVENSEKGVYKGMKKFLDGKIKTNKFNPEKYNEEIAQKVRKIIDD